MQNFHFRMNLKLYCFSFELNPTNLPDKLTVVYVALKLYFQPVSIYPQCINDISFWLPTNKTFQPNDFFDLVRETASEVVEQVRKILLLMQIIYLYCP